MSYGFFREPAIYWLPDGGISLRFFVLAETNFPSTRADGLPEIYRVDGLVGYEDRNNPVAVQSAVMRAFGKMFDAWNKSQPTHKEGEDWKAPA